MRGLLILGNPFSALLTGVGVLALAGIVVNNNIILIDTFNHIRRANPQLDTADIIVRATAQRLRPVLLTTITTVSGLLPLACGFSVDLVNRSITPDGDMAIFWAPLSQAIVFGLSFATLLTLVATPRCSPCRRTCATNCTGCRDYQARCALGHHDPPVPEHSFQLILILRSQDA